MDPYKTCPIFENARYKLRLVCPADANDLLTVYADEKAVPLFNSDNCNGDDFHYTTLAQMQQAIRFWLESYRQRDFVRWSIIDKPAGIAIGTIELFNRHAGDYFDNCGILRLDLRSDYEHADEIKNIVLLILEPAFSMFACPMIATKIPPFANERKAALAALGFIPTDEKLIGGHDGRIYTNYDILHK